MCARAALILELAVAAGGVVFEFVAQAAHVDAQIVTMPHAPACMAGPLKGHGKLPKLSGLKMALRQTSLSHRPGLTGPAATYGYKLSDSA
jgi:hypothetical protein